uniref:LPD7 domain-containing protein n=1 Tax=Escherichia coli TaxID=562 RepID=UPI00308297DC
AVRVDGERLQESREASREGLQEALRLAMERYGNRITVNGTTEFKAQIIRAAVDSQLPITFSDPVLEVRRQALIGGSDTPAKPTIKKPGVGPVGDVPPAARQGRLRTLSQIEALHIEGASIPTPKPAPIPAINDQERRKAKLQAELNAKKEKEQK